MPTFKPSFSSTLACAARAARASAQALALALGALALLGSAAHAQRAGSVVIRVPIDPVALPSSTHAVNLGGVFVGESASHDMRFVNQTSEATTVSAVRAAHGAGLVFSADNCTGRTLLPNQNCTVRATATVTEAGPFLAGAQVAHSANPVPDVWHFRATGLVRHASLRVSAPALDFGAVAVGTQSPPQVLRLTNDGTQPLGVAEVFAQGQALAWRVDASACLGQLLPGASCDVQVRLAPASAGPVSAHLHVQVSGESPAALAVLRGAGGLGLPSFAPASLQWTAQAPGVDAPAQRVVLTNQGSAALELGTLGTAGAALALEGDAAFRVLATDCPVTLAPGAACNLDLSVHLPDAQSRAGALVLRSGSAQIASVDLLAQGEQAAGAGGGGQRAITEFSLQFGLTNPLAAQEREVRIHSANAIPIDVTHYEITGPGAAAFSVVNAAACSSELAQGRSCDLRVRFNPATAAEHTAQLVVFNQADLSRIHVALVGNHTTNAFVLSSNHVDFGAREPTSFEMGPGASVTLLLMNQGTETLYSLNVVTSGDGQFGAYHGCSWYLAPGQSCAIEVQFYSLRTGPHHGVLHVHGHVGSGGGEVEVARATLAGLTLGPALGLSTTVLDLGNVGPNSSAQAVVTVTNTGTADEPALWFTGPSMLGPFAATQGGTCVLHGPLARGASCTIVLNLSWGPQGGLRQGRLDVGFLNQPPQSVDIFINVLAGVTLPIP